MLRVCPAGVPSCRSRRPVVASSRPTGIDPPSSDRPAAACCRRRGREARGREPLSRWMLFAERLESQPAPTVSDRRSACRRRDVPGGDDGQTLRGELAARHRDRDGLPLRKERCLRIGTGRSRLALRFGQPDLWARPIERSPIASRQRFDSASIALPTAPPTFGGFGQSVQTLTIRSPSQSPHHRLSKGILVVRNCGRAVWHTARSCRLETGPVRHSGMTEVTVLPVNPV